MNKVYPVGYNRYGAKERIEELMAQPKMLLIDTRLKPYSWRCDYRHDEMKAQYGKRYRWAGKFLGNINYQGGPIQIASPAMGIGGLAGYLNGGWDLLMLCQCPEFEECHMKEICRLLVGVRPGVEVIKFVQPVRQSPAG